jgi:hypothetical protein
VEYIAGSGKIVIFAVWLINKTFENENIGSNKEAK